MKISILAFAVATMASISPTFAWTYNLSHDLGISGFQRQCEYSDGNVYAVQSTDLCPMTIEAPSPGMGSGTGFLKGEYEDGMTKVCVYDVLGEKQATRIGSVELCPLTEKF